jgi:Rha family phage regulatory protein
MHNLVVTAEPYSPVVTIKGDRAFANSRDVAEFFDKDHRSVLRAIDDLIETDPEGMHSFVQAPYIHPQNGQSYRAFDMDQEGFTLLAMGFTGPKALHFKRLYIRAFNAAMEEIQRMKTQVALLPDFSNPAEAARAWADQFDRADQAEKQLANLRPKADFADRFLLAEGTYTTTQVAAKLGLSAQALNRELHRLGIIKRTRKRWLPRKQYLNQGYFRLVPVVDLIGIGRGMQMLWTPAGVQWLLQTIAPMLASR